MPVAPLIPTLLALGLAAAPLAARPGLGERPFLAGCAQMTVTDRVADNLERAVRFIRRADSLGVELLLFPETALSGYRPLHFQDKPFPAREELEQALARVREETARAGIFVVIGTSDWRGDSLYNTAHLLGRDGAILATFDKLHGTGGAVYAAGRSFRPVELEGLKCGLQICYDARFPEPWRLLALEGVSVMLHISHAAGGDSWKIPVWEGHLRSRAAENGIWVVSCNCAGPVQAGKSYVIDPDGLLHAESNQDREELITAVVDPTRPLRGILWSRRDYLYRVERADSQSGGK